MMQRRQSLILQCLLLLHSAHCLHLSQPNSTALNAVTPKQDGWTPRPTSGPASHGYVASLEQRLFARQNSSGENTCGYYSGLAGNPITCGPGSTCVFYSQSPANFHCCSTSCNGYISACANYPNNGPLEPDGLPVYATDNYVFYCPSELPFCTGVILSDTSANIAYTSYGCRSGPDVTTFTAYPDTMPVAAVQQSETATVTSDGGGPSPDPGILPGNPTSRAASMPFSMSTGITSTPHSGGISHSATVGIGVGVGLGLGGILLGLGLFIFFRARDRRKRSEVARPPQTNDGSLPSWYYDHTGTSHAYKPEPYRYQAFSPPTAELPGERGMQELGGH